MTHHDRQHSPIDDEALDGLAVAPPDSDAETGDARARPGDAGRDNHLADDEDDTDAQLDEALDESMDASDPPAAVQPGSDRAND